MAGSPVVRHINERCGNQRGGCSNPALGAIVNTGFNNHSALNVIRNCTAGFTAISLPKPDQSFLHPPSARNVSSFISVVGGDR
jgi:hypothetical protein